MTDLPPPPPSNADIHIHPNLSNLSNLSITNPNAINLSTSINRSSLPSSDSTNGKTLRAEDHIVGF
jgi:hypothetical protein